MNRTFVIAATLITAWMSVASAQTTSPASSADTPHKPAEARPLKVGDISPPISIERFLKGDPIGRFESGHIYVLEFWATWCGPCIQAMPHLSKLQAQYKDRSVTIIGVNVREMRRVGEGWEEAFDADTLARVQAFVEKQGDRMAYTVAYDGPARSMDKNWIQASGTQGIPVTFIIDRTGKLAWIGHPILLRMPLDEIATDRWDIATGPQRVKQAEDAYLSAMRLFTSDAQAGLRAWDQAAKDYPLLARDLIQPKFDALLAAGLWNAADDAAESIFAEASQDRDAARLNHLAWSIVDPRLNRPTKNMDLAWRAASKANDLTEERDAGILDTLARVHFCKGEVDKAIEIQLKAINLADDGMKARLAPALDEYRKAR